MSNVKVAFLGEEVIIPSELREYVEYLQYFDEIRNDLMPLVTNQIKKREYTGGGEEFAYFSVPLANSGKKVIAELAKKGVLDVTLDDLVYKNKGYTELNNVCTETVKGMSRILSDAIDRWLAGYNNAYNAATSKISGPGFGILTSSVSSLLLYSAIESSTLKRQANEADRDFRNAMQELSDKNSNEQEIEENKLLTTSYYPGAAAALDIFVSEMMETYIQKLEEHRLFDGSKVLKYNISRSTELLGNMSLVSDKKELLKQAFLCCPYNPDVYKAVLDNQLADIKTFQTAEYLLQDEILIGALRTFCKDNSTNYKLVEAPIQILALYTGTDASVLYRKLYGKQLADVYKKYQLLKNALNDRAALISLISNYISPDAITLCKMNKTEIYDSISAFVRCEIADSALVLSFVKAGIVKANEISLTTANQGNLSDIDNQYITALSGVMDKYLVDLRAHVQLCETKAREIKSEYDDAMARYKKDLQAMTEDMKQLQQQRDSLGLFAFGQKKDLDTAIDKQKRRIEAYKKNNPTIAAKEEYKGVVDEAKRFI